MFGSDPKVAMVLRELQATKGWPFDPATDEVFVKDLMSQFPRLDLPEEVRKYRAWLYDYDGKKKVRHRARFRNWCRNAGRGWPGKDRGTAAAQGRGDRSTPRTAADHGPTSDRLEQW